MLDLVVLMLTIFLTYFHKQFFSFLLFKFKEKSRWGHFRCKLPSPHRLVTGCIHPSRERLISWILHFFFSPFVYYFQKEYSSIEPCYFSADVPLPTSIPFMVDYSFQVQEKEKVVPINYWIKIVHSRWLLPLSQLLGEFSDPAPGDVLMSGCAPKS